MKRLAVLLLALAACAPALTPQQEAERDIREARLTEDLQRKLKLLDRAVALYPTAEAHAERALIADSIAIYTEALQFIGDQPLRATLLLNRGMLYGRQRRYEEADADLSEVIRATGSPEAYLERAWFRRRAGRGADAERDILEARRVGNGLADPLYNEGVRAAQRGDADEAERMFRFALDLDPDHVRSHIAMARINMERHRFADAVKEYDLAIPAHPRDAELYYHRGNAQLAAGRGEQALADYDMAVELAPSEPLYLAARGVVQHRVRRDISKALEDFERAIRMDPKCFPAWYNRGLLRHDQKELEAAEKDLLRATSIRASPEGCLALGRVLHDRGAYDKALTLYRGALEIYREAEIRKSIADELERTRRAKENKK